MRVFETKEDVYNESEVIKKFCNWTDSEFFKLPQFEIDFLIYKNDINVAFAEVKCKKNDYNSFKEEFIGLPKYFSLKKYSQLKPTYLIIKYNDGIYFIDFKDIPTEIIKYGGRKIVRDGSTNDKEWLITFNRSVLKKIK